MGGCCSSTDSLTEERRDMDRRVSQKLLAGRTEGRGEKKLLLLGPGSSGKSTIFKQLLFIHDDKDHEALRSVGRDAIHRAVIAQVREICAMLGDDGDEDKEEIDSDSESSSVEYAVSAQYDICEETAAICGQLLDGDWKRLDDAVTALIQKWWNDAAIKAAFAARNNLAIADSTPHFLDNLSALNASDYRPTEDDILLVRIKTSGIMRGTFVCGDPKHPGNEFRFQLVDCGGQKSERSKWVQIMDDAIAVLYVASLSCFDQTLYEDRSRNGMEETFELFGELIIDSRWFRNTCVILFLNKVDLFEEKVKRTPITVCPLLADYSGAPDDAQLSKEFIARKFDERANDGGTGTRAVFQHFTCATDRGKVQQVFADVQQSVVADVFLRTGMW